MACNLKPDPRQRYTLDGLAHLMPDLDREALENAVEALTAAGVLTKDSDQSGEPMYRYTHPDRYRLIDVPDVKVPGPDFGRR